MARLVRGPRIPSSVPGAWRSLIEDMTARAASDRPSAAAVRDRLEVDGAPRSEVTGALPGHGPPGGCDTTEIGRPGPATEVLPTSGRWDRPEALAPRAGGVGAGRGLVLVVLISVALAGGGGGSDVETPPTSTTVQPATAPPTTAPPTTATTSDRRGGRPPGEHEGKGAGKGEPKPKAKGAKKP